jgi:succinate-semialdehyde dehydrogenase/glutarate-semialdehyde dehydrogenase
MNAPLTIHGQTTPDEALAEANAPAYGLTAAIFTGDVNAGLRYADSVHMGLVNINETTNYWEPHLPWGGRARSQSGIGRVGGRFAFDSFTELKTVVIDLG